MLEPNREDLQSGIPFDYFEFRYTCLACGQTDSFIDAMSEELRLAKEDPFGGEDVIIDCGGCGAAMFDLTEGYCHLCGYSYQPPRCGGCNRTLERYEAESGSLCDRCSEYAHYNDEYEPNIS